MGITDESIMKTKEEIEAQIKIIDELLTRRHLSIDEMIEDMINIRNNLNKKLKIFEKNENKR